MRMVRHGVIANIVPFPAVPPVEVVPKSAPLEFRVRPAVGREPSPFSPVKACRIASVQGAPGVVGGVNEKTVPHPKMA
jgi:hypothetical protein